jgi:hypothetical protein
MTYVCVVCRRRYTDEDRHVASDAHLEAMADQTVEEWSALPPYDPTAVGIAKQIARMEYFGEDYDGWRRAMGLPDTPETLLINRRISAVWIRSLRMPDWNERMEYARKVIRLEIEGIEFEP